MASLADVVAVGSEEGDSGSEEVMPIAGQRLIGKFQVRKADWSSVLRS